MPLAFSKILSLVLCAAVSSGAIICRCAAGGEACGRAMAVAKAPVERGCSECEHSSDRGQPASKGSKNTQCPHCGSSGQTDRAVSHEAGISLKPMVAVAAMVLAVTPVSIGQSQALVVSRGIAIDKPPGDLVHTFVMLTV
jgi:hypothetical protein